MTNYNTVASVSRKNREKSIAPAVIVKGIEEGTTLKATVTKGTNSFQVNIRNNSILNLFYGFGEYTITADNGSVSTFTVNANNLYRTQIASVFGNIFGLRVDTTSTGYTTAWVDANKQEIDMPDNWGEWYRLVPIYKEMKPVELNLTPTTNSTLKFEESEIKNNALDKYPNGTTRAGWTSTTGDNLMDAMKIPRFAWSVKQILAEGSSSYSVEPKTETWQHNTYVTITADISADGSISVYKSSGGGTATNMVICYPASDTYSASSEITKIPFPLQEGEHNIAVTIWWDNQSGVRQDHNNHSLTYRVSKSSSYKSTTYFWVKYVPRNEYDNELTHKEIENSSEYGQWNYRMFASNNVTDSLNGSMVHNYYTYLAMNPSQLKTRNTSSSFAVNANSQLNRTPTALPEIVGNVTNNDKSYKTNYFANDTYGYKIGATGYTGTLANFMSYETYMGMTILMLIRAKGATVLNNYRVIPDSNKFRIINDSDAAYGLDYKVTSGYGNSLASVSVLLGMVNWMYGEYSDTYRKYIAGTLMQGAGGTTMQGADVSQDFYKFHMYSISNTSVNQSGGLTLDSIKSNFDKYDIEKFSSPSERRYGAFPTFVNTSKVVTSTDSQTKTLKVWSSSTTDFGYIYSHIRTSGASGSIKYNKGEEGFTLTGNWAFTFVPDIDWINSIPTNASNVQVYARVNYSNAVNVIRLFTSQGNGDSPAVSTFTNTTTANSINTQTINLGDRQSALTAIDNAYRSFASSSQPNTVPFFSIVGTSSNVSLTVTKIEVFITYTYTETVDTTYPTLDSSFGKALGYTGAVNYNNYTQIIGGAHGPLSMALCTPDSDTSPAIRHFIATRIQLWPDESNVSINTTRGVN